MDNENLSADILIVDDDASTQQTLAAFLTREGYRVHIVDNEKAAIQSILTKPPSLIFLNIQIPSADAFDTYLRYIGDDWIVPIVFMGSRDEILEKIEIYPITKADYMIKPFHPALVSRRVKTLLAFHATCLRSQQLVKQLNQEVVTRRKVEQEIKKHQKNLESAVQQRTQDLENALARERATQTHLLQTERLTSMGRLAASIAHEIKNPMQSILGCLDLAEEAVKDGRDPDKYFSVAREAVDNVTDILDRMRDLKRQPDKTRVVTDVNALIEKVVTLTGKHLSDHNIEVDWKPEKLPKIWMVSGEIHQVLLNLLLNAQESMPDGGVIKIRTSTTDSPPGVRIDVIDQGHGIPPEDMPHIFEPFFTTSPDGTGLGLAISYSIIQDHGGQLNVSSQPGLGTTFSFWLPVSLRAKSRK